MTVKDYPKPTTEQPDTTYLLEHAALSGACLTTDGCTVEPDGICEHGHSSWLLYLGLI